MMVFKRKQIVVLSLVLMVVIAGYLQYSYNKSSVSVNDDVEYLSELDEADTETTRLGEAVYVDNLDLNEEAIKDDEKAKPEDEKDKSKDKDEKAAQASKEANNFFAQAKLDRDVIRGKDKEALEEITKDTNASKDQKNAAYDQMLTILENSDKEMRVETLIKDRGFNDVIVLFGNDGCVDVVVKSPNLSSSQVAQISEIVSRQANVKMDKIHIRNKF